MDKKRQIAAAPAGHIEPHSGLLTLPPAGQRIYKMMEVDHLVKSISGAYLHFKRVDSYKDFKGSDPYDGEQLPLDRRGNARTAFEKNPTFTAAHYYDLCRQRTYACCFSLDNSDFIWLNYANRHVNGKVCVVFDFYKLRERINTILTSSKLISNGAECVQIFNVNYGLAFGPWPG